MKIIRPRSGQTMPANARRVFKGVIFDVYQWRQKMYDGTNAVFEKLKRPDTVMVIPVTEDGKIIVGLQEQPGTAKHLSLIAGRVDAGEDVLHAAKRELLEETGHQASEWVLLDAYQPTLKIDWAIFTFIARGCTQVSEQNLDAGEKIDLKLLNFKQFIDKVVRGDFGEYELKIKILEAKLNRKKMEKMKKILFDRSVS